MGALLCLRRLLERSELFGVLCGLASLGHLRLGDQHPPFSLDNLVPGLCCLGGCGDGLLEFALCNEAAHDEGCGLTQRLCVATTGDGGLRLLRDIQGLAHLAEREVAVHYQPGGLGLNQGVGARRCLEVIGHLQSLLHIVGVDEGPHGQADNRACLRGVGLCSEQLCGLLASHARFLDAILLVPLRSVEVRLNRGLHGLCPAGLPSLCHRLPERHQRGRRRRILDGFDLGLVLVQEGEVRPWRSDRRRPDLKHLLPPEGEHVLVESVLVKPAELLPIEAHSASRFRGLLPLALGLPSRQARSRN
mmetsp:Transcript_57871/g.167875  ORF Transcript_57871/g.167875 Transcript_57871/m.167875 type:complete len:304 (+) Transcript_57871:424-1335(+)